MTHLVYDAIIAALLVFFVLQGKRKGFILTLCGLLAVFVAFLGAAFLSDLMCEPVGRLLQPILEENIDQTIHTIVGQTVQQGRLYASLPDQNIPQVLAALEDSQLYCLFTQALQSALDKGLLEITTTATAAIAAYLAREVARIVLFVISFVVVLLAWNLLSRVLDLAFRLPVLSSVNAALGAVLGLIKGGLFIFAGVWLFKDHLSPQLVEQTVLLNFFYSTTPLAIVAKQVQLAKMTRTLP